MATKPLTVSLCSEPHTGDVQASFGFLKWSDLYLKEKPFQVYIDIPKDAPDQRRHNLNFEEDIEYTVHSVRGRETQYTLDENGFAYVKHKSSMTAQDFQDEHTVVQRYYEELEELLKRHMDGVDQVCIFDWRIRSSDLTPYEGKIINFNNPVQPLAPATHVHVDQSAAAALRRVQLHLPEQADHLVQGRLRIINIWRPINGPVRQWPFAICDGSTVDQDKLIETDHVRRQYAGVTLYALKDPGMEWYYMPEQEDDEVLLFKNFDSETDVVINAPHASFQLPEMVKASDSLPPRESIEVRVMVFTYPENMP